MPRQAPVTFGDAFRFWLKLGFINFGGPAGQIAIMHRELVDQRRWVAEPLFLRALNFSMLLPGPEKPSSRSRACVGTVFPRTGWCRLERWRA
jgi:chromate transporter